MYLIYLFLCVICGQSVAIGFGINNKQTVNDQKGFYILFANQVEDPTWPKGYEGFSVFIVQPQNITSDLVQMIKKTTGATVLAYWDSIHIPIKVGCSTGHVMGDKPGRNCTTSYQCGPGDYSRAISQMFPPKYALNMINSNGTYSIMCTYPGLATFIPSQDTSKIIANFLSKVVFDAQFDGIYLDNTVDVQLLEKGFESILQNIDFDCDGDGKKNTMTEFLMQYQAWAPYVAFQLRQNLGPNAFILGNSAGALSNPDFNGITLEMEACLETKVCMDALQGQYSVHPNGALSILWLTHSEVMPPSEQCQLVAQWQAQMPWIFAGTDYFDGSHILCS